MQAGLRSQLGLYVLHPDATPENRRRTLMLGMIISTGLCGLAARPPTPILPMPRVHFSVF